MNTTRRNFLRTSAGFAATLIARDLWAIETPASKARAYDFTELPREGHAAKITRITPDDASYVQTYYDVLPWSPSKRFFACTRVLPLDRNPRLGEKAECCVIDLHERTIRTVYSTVCWGFQTGAVVNWGATDRYLFTNDVIHGRAVSVCVDLETGETKAFAGPGYHVAPDDSCVVGFPLELMHVTQGGYGMPPADEKNPPKLPPGAAKDEGTWRTDLKTNERKLIVSLADAAALIREKAPRENGTFYFWHAKFNRQGTRIMQILRCIFPDGYGARNPMVVTFKPDGSDVRFTPFKPVWDAGGGHPNWHGNGDFIVRHVDVDELPRFVMARYDADEMIVLSDKFRATGHPSVEPAGRYMITDDHPQRGKEQHVLLRFFDLKAQKETLVCKLPTVFRPTLSTIDLRLDGHPVWSRDYKQCSLQAAHKDMRQLFVVDLAELM